MGKKGYIRGGRIVLFIWGCLLWSCIWAGSGKTGQVFAQGTESYQICFLGNGADTGNMEAMKDLRYDAEYPLARNQFARRGYFFVGWNTKADGSGTDYRDEEIVSGLTQIDQKVVYLYAQWREEKYEIRYVLNGGTQNAKNPTSYTIRSANIKLKAPTRKGYLFQGWYQDAAKTRTQGMIRTGSVGDRTVYAKWKVQTYQITYQLDHGRNAKKNPKSYKITTTPVTLLEATRKGYVFKGWYLDARYKTPIKKIEKGRTGDLKLYAKWKVITYKIYYHKNGATAGTMQKVTVPYGKNITLELNNYIKWNANFKGWNTRADGSGNAYVDQAMVSDLTNKDGEIIHLYAQWEAMSEQTKQMAREVIRYVNACRSATGLSKLGSDKKLMAIAQERARELARCWGHERPDGTRCFSLFEKTHYSYRAAGENIAYGYTTSKAVMEGWLNSQPHRENILKSRYTKIGVGVYYANGVYYWVQNFSG